MPAAGQRLTISPRTVLPPLSRARPSLAAAAPLPSSSTMGLALQPGCVWASITRGCDTASVTPGLIVATPPANRFTLARSPGAALPLPIMKTTCSMPAVRPLTASAASLPSVLALVMTWRSEPWPEALALTTVEKLNPKSTPATVPLPTVTGATACAVPTRPAVNCRLPVSSVVPLAPAPGSAAAGCVPPTKSVTATALPLPAWVR
jgi:hypothetical protein